MNKTILITSDTFEQMQLSELFFYNNIVLNDEYEGYDILANIDDQTQRKQIMQVALNHYTHEQRYSKAVEVLGIENVLRYAPTKLVKAIEEKGINNLDEHLNGIVPLESFDVNFSAFAPLMGKNKKVLSKLNVINSKSCWVCIIKQALRIKYTA